jgi:hypothetical protein
VITRIGLVKRVKKMKTFRNITLFYSCLIVALFFANCKKNNPVTDIDQTAALRNVTVTYDSITFQLGLPAGAISGKTFDQLRTEDPTTYTNPANYSITFSGNYTANNKKSNAQDAKFDGMTIIMIMDTIKSSPINTTANAFEVKKNTSIPVQLKGTINLATHKRAGIYIFKQVVAGNDLVTTQTLALNYKIGVLQGTIDLPSIKENIPTRASAQTKDFLRGLLNSGIFN